LANLFKSFGNFFPHRWGRCYDHNCLRFSSIFREKLSRKPTLLSIFSIIKLRLRVKKSYSSPTFLAKIFKKSYHRSQVMF
jgi:hypothetical protein